MTYQYKCPRCKKVSFINKPMTESSRSEYCQNEKCKDVQLARVFTVGGIKTGDGSKF